MIVNYTYNPMLTAESLDQVITGLKEQGYELVPISQLIYKDDYSINHEGRQIQK